MKRYSMQRPIARTSLVQHLQHATLPALDTPLHPYPCLLLQCRHRLLGSTFHQQVPMRHMHLTILRHLLPITLPILPRMATPCPHLSIASSHAHSLLSIKISDTLPTIPEALTSASPHTTTAAHLAAVAAPSTTAENIGIELGL
jgi:hypothetical protein